MSDEALRSEIHKRLTLNWLIQGASQHAGTTFHHLVRDELNALDPRLIRLYDQFGLVVLLQYWQMSSAFIHGWPPRFWRLSLTRRSHPFFGHVLLSKYGGMLAEACRQRAMERSKGKGLMLLPVVFSFQTTFLVFRLQRLERPHREKLIQLAKTATSMVWRIPTERLDASLTDSIVVPLAKGMIPARNAREQMIRSCIVGVGGVMKRGDALIVCARGSNWQLLAKELVKGTAELICLHGLNQLSDTTYRKVLDATDRLEYESWMLQSGGELWRRLLVASPNEMPLAMLLMHLARLPNATLESLITDVLERPAAAKERLANLADESQR